MTKTTLTGIVKNIEINQSKNNTTYGVISLESKFVKQDNSVVVIYDRVSVFDNYLLSTLNTLQINDAVAIEAFGTANSYQKQDGSYAASINYTAKSIDNITKYAYGSTQQPTQQPMQQPTQQPMQQPTMFYTSTNEALSNNPQQQYNNMYNTQSNYPTGNNNGNMPPL